MEPTDIARLRQLYERYDRTAGRPARLWLLLRHLWPALDRWMPALLWRAERVAQLDAAIERQASRIRELEAQDARRRDRQRIYKARPRASGGRCGRRPMPDAHLPSDDTAITAAQDSLTAIARRVLQQRVEEHLRRPTRWSHEALVAASAAVWDRRVADLEEALGKERGSLGSEQGAGFETVRLVPRRKAVCAKTDGDCA